MTKDTIYWIFSTLPQVLAALAGLIMAGLAIYDQNLKREIDRDSSLKSIINPIQKRLFRESMVFFIISVLAIIADVVAMGYAEEVQTYYEGAIKNDLTAVNEWKKWIWLLGGIGVLNFAALFLLFPLLYSVLNPNIRTKVRGKEKKKVMEELDKELNATTQVSPNKEKASSTMKTVSPELFSDYYHEFEKIVGDYFPDNRRLGRIENMSRLIRRLFDSGIIPREFKRPEIQNIVKLHNLQLHGEDIGQQNEKIVHILKELTHILRERLPEFMVDKLGERGEMWKRWIDNNVADFDEAHNLDQAIRYHQSYGEYNVLFNGYCIVVTPSDGKRLVLPHSAVQEFLRYLEARFSPSELSLEEEKSFQEDLAKIKDEEGE